MHYLDSHLHHVDTLPRSVKRECSAYIAMALRTNYIHQWCLICTIRVWYNNPYHTRMVIPYAYTCMVCTIRVWYKYAYGTEQLQDSLRVYPGIVSGADLGFLRGGLITVVDL